MRFSALGDSAVVAELEGGISAATLERVRRFSERVKNAKLVGVTDIVPAFATVTIFYDPVRIPVVDELPHAHLTRELTRLANLVENAESLAERSREMVVPVCYGGDYGPDLAVVARHAGISEVEVVALHSGAEYVVHAIGFSPGFPYLGGLPEKLHAPRLSTPRVSVAAGSVGIGGAQTGVYPLATPGGWQLIGRTPLRLFDPVRTPPALLRLGDRVKFRAIGPEEFLRVPAER